MSPETSLPASESVQPSDPDGIEVRRPDDPAQTTLGSIARKVDRFNGTLNALKDNSFSPDRNKKLNRQWRIGQVAEMVGRTSQYIRQKEASGDLDPAPKDEHGRRTGYTLAAINAMRDYFKKRPSRGPGDEPAVISFSSFKGGCGKSCMSVHFAQYLALRSYKVLFIDSDPQGSSSTLFGLDLDLDLSDLDVATEEFSEQSGAKLQDFIEGETDNFSDCVRPSYFTGIDIVPAGIDLNNAEYHLASNVREDKDVLLRLGRGIRQVWDDYDVVVIDPPPALGFMSLSVLAAANALVTPMRPTSIDFASTAKFMDMLHSYIETLVGSFAFPIYYHFHTILINGLEDNVTAQEEIAFAMRKIFGSEDLLEAMMRKSAAIDNATKELRTVYDLSRPLTNHETHNRCLSYLDAWCSELEIRIRRTWPSHRADLRAAAAI